MPTSKSVLRDTIIIRGARVNNLKNIDVDIPRDKLVVVTGLSGSGKSSLAFDVVYSEGNRRYLESVSSYARQFLDVGAKPDVDKIENLSPTIAIDQKSLNRSPRSTVGTLTDVYDYLRVLYARIGTPHCPKCGKILMRKETSEMMEEILNLAENTQVAILAPVKEVNKSSTEILRQVSQMGYARVRYNQKVHLVEEAMALLKNGVSSNVDIVVDRLVVKHDRPDRERIMDSLETALKIGRGSLVLWLDYQEERMYNRDFFCDNCQVRIGEITPRHFSFNNPEGACAHCAGLGITREVDADLVIPNKKLSLLEGAIMPWSKSAGRGNGQNNNLGILKALSREFGFSLDQPVSKLPQEVLKKILWGSEKKEILVEQKDDLGGTREVRVFFEGVLPMLKKKYEEAKSDFVRSDLEKYMLEKTCPACQGKRLKTEYLAVFVADSSIDMVVNSDLKSFLEFIDKVEKLEAKTGRSEALKPLFKEMRIKAEALCDVGLEYLSLNRSADTLSGGEGQRIRLASQIGSELMGVVYVLDEPSIGLHNRDTQKLISSMKAIHSEGNSLIVVEHDEDIIRSADWVIDMGPGAGEEGGEVIFSGPLNKMLKSKTLTADYLSGRKKVSEKKKYRTGSKKSIHILGATEHNLKNIDVEIPLGKFVSITGVSGSGKSTLVSDILSKSLAKHFFNAKATPGQHKKIEGLKHIDKVISIDQSPIGRTPRSNAATYTGVFSLVRDLFASTEEAKNRGYTASRFSFNMKGGRCEVCQGDGTKKIEMHLLPDMYVKCEACHGTRYNQKTLEIEYQGVNVADVLEMSVSYALQFFRKWPLIVEKLSTLEQVGLGYLKLGQSATNLSGGEAQRIKLATELARKSTGNTLYILDEPTIGLHFSDVKRLLGVLDALVDKGNSVIVVEHNVDVIRHSDWVIDLGPEGGKEGGEIVYAGTPDKLNKCKKSWTGKYL